MLKSVERPRPRAPLARGRDPGHGRELVPRMVVDIRRHCPENEVIGAEVASEGCLAASKRVAKHDRRPH
jgi:hypothetical protein